jgi:CRISPR/Cas system-associated protein Csm6
MFQGELPTASTLWQKYAGSFRHQGGCPQALAFLVKENVAMNEQGENTQKQPLLIMTVGMSLLTNRGGGGHKEDSPIAALNKICQSPYRPTAAELLEKLKPFISTEGVKAELAYFEPEQRQNKAELRRNRLPQELSYLALLANNEDLMPTTEEKWTVALLASDSESGELCAQVICDILADSARPAPWDRFELHPTDGLNRIKDLKIEGETLAEAIIVKDLFTNSGLPTLIAKIRGLSEKRDKVIINLTGGFKGVIPYSTIAAMFLDASSVHIHYLFESTPNILDLPIYPIGLDFPTWHCEAALLKVVRQLPDGEARNQYIKAMGPRMQAIANEIMAQKDVKNPDSLPRILLDRYEQQLETDPLQQYSVRVVTQFLPEGSFQQRLVELIQNIGPRIWLGDKLPMAADHAVRHHHDLLEIAQLFLTPIADAKCERSETRFLNDEERFVLLCAVLLHDCGHSLDALPQIGSDDGAGAETLVPLFTSEIREYHQFLAWYRLTTCQKDADLQWDTTAELAQAVAWLCVYHRRRTGWEKDEEYSFGKQYCPYLEAKFLPPLEVTQFKANNVDFPKLVALLRLIDGCDNQSRRAGRGEDPRMVREMLDRDSKTWLARLKAILPIASDACKRLDTTTGDAPNQWSTATDFLEDLTSAVAAGDDSVSTSKAFSPEVWEVRIAFGKELALGGFASVIERNGATLWLEAARCFDDLKLRGRQYVHVIKHQAVRSILVVPGQDFNEDTCWSFDVRMKPDKELNDPEFDKPGTLLIDNPDFADHYKDEIGLFEPKGTTLSGEEQKRPFNTVREWITQEISSELTQDSADYLAKASGRTFKVRYKWTDQDDNADGREIISHS